MMMITMDLLNKAKVPMELLAANEATMVKEDKATSPRTPCGVEPETMAPPIMDPTNSSLAITIGIKDPLVADLGETMTETMTVTTPWLVAVVADLAMEV